MAAPVAVAAVPRNRRRVVERRDMDPPIDGVALKSPRPDYTGISRMANPRIAPSRPVLAPSYGFPAVVISRPEDTRSDAEASAGNRWFAGLVPRSRTTPGGGIRETRVECRSGPGFSC